MKFERVLMDIEAQHDFFVPTGSCYTKDAAAAARHIYSLFRWARANQVPVISTVLRVRREDRGPLTARPHCIEGSEGERKLLRTVLPKRVNLGLRNVTDVPVGVFDQYQQVVFEKRNTDIFAHAAAERLLTDITAATFVLCGAGLACGIVEAAIGLRTRGFGVILASDAVVALGHPLEEMACRRMEAKGVIFVPTEKIVELIPRPSAEAIRRMQLERARASSD